MIRFFRTGQVVPEWLEKISAPEENKIPVATFGSPTIVVKKDGAFHMWSATSFGRGCAIFIGGEWKSLRIQAQGSGVNFHGEFTSFLKVIFQRAADKKGGAA